MSAGAGMPPMPMPPMMGGNLELQATGTRTNLLGYDCQGFEVKQRGEILTIWATDQLLPFQIYLPTEPRRFGPPVVEEQWGKTLADKKLFPLLAILQGPNGMERYRFEVDSIKPMTLGTNAYARLVPPAGYVELHPHQF